MATAVAERPVVDATEPAPLMTHRQILLVMYGLMAGMFLSSLDQTIVGTAIRTIGDDLHGLDQQAWVTTAYLIAATVTTPLYGKLSDIFGRRPLFLTSISIFVLGSFLSSFATSMLTLAAFRAFQGLGAGGLMSLPLAIIGDMLAPRERARYQGYFLATFGVASVIGPLIGGLFAGTETILGIAGWRWVFLVNVPVGIVALFMVFSFLHLPHLPHGKARIDWWGAGLVVATLAPLLLVAEQGREWGWGSPAAIACYAIGAVGLVSFLLVERALGANAIIPLRLFGAKGFSPAVVLSVLVGFGMFGAMMTIPLYLQIVLGFTPTQSGFATLPMMFGVMLASVGTGQLVARTGKYAVFPITGTATTAGGFLILTFMSPDKPYWYLALAMFVIGAGLGQLMQTLTMAVQAAAEPQDIGVATSSSTFFRQIGGTLGTAVMLSLLFSVLPTNITASLSDETITRNALDAALDPAVANDPANAAIMAKMWTPITDRIKEQVDANLADATKQVKEQVEATLRQQVSDAAHAKAADGAKELARGLDGMSTGLSKLTDGTSAFVSGVDKLGEGASALAKGTSQAATGARQLAGGASQLSQGLGQVSDATDAAAKESQQAAADYAAVQDALSTLTKDQQACEAGDAGSCGHEDADTAALQDAVKALGSSVYTTSGYLNGSDSKPGIASGLSGLAAGADGLASGADKLAGGLGKLTTGTSQLASGAQTAASKGAAIPEGLSKVTDGSTKLGDGVGKLSTIEQTIDDKVKELLPDATDKALAKVADEKHLSVVDSRLTVDWSDPAQRSTMVDELTPKLIDQLNSGTGDTSVETDTSASDTSFLSGADARLTKPFMVGFNQSVVTIYWCGLAVMLLAFAVTLFYRVPALRTRSALQERAEGANAREEEETA